jgi:hypothetical protein
VKDQEFAYEQFLEKERLRKLKLTANKSHLLIGPKSEPQLSSEKLKKKQQKADKKEMEALDLVRER